MVLLCLYMATDFSLFLLFLYFHFVTIGKVLKTLHSNLVCILHWIYFELKKADHVLFIPAPKDVCLQGMVAMSFIKHYNPKRAVF